MDLHNSLGWPMKIKWKREAERKLKMTITKEIGNSRGKCLKQLLLGLTRVGQKSMFPEISSISETESDVGMSSQSVSRKVGVWSWRNIWIQEAHVYKSNTNYKWMDLWVISRPYKYHFHQGTEYFQHSESWNFTSFQILPVISCYFFGGMS